MWWLSILIALWGGGTSIDPQPTSPAAQVSLEHAEIIQSVQRDDNGVQLVAGKSSLVRFVFGESGSSPITVDGTIRLSRNNQSAEIESYNSVQINPNENNQVEAKRIRSDGTLNFQLPGSWTTPGITKIELISIKDSTSGQTLSCDTCATFKTNAEFISVPPLQIQIIAVGYYEPGHSIRIYPRPEDIESIKSWLSRAYPVSDVKVSVLQSNESDLALRSPISSSWCSDIRPALSILRNEDVLSSPSKARIHYYGLVADTVTFVRGDSDISSTFDPENVVAIGCGPSGDPKTQKFSWDKSNSYAGWYTGHEIAHTFGLLHPVTAQPPKFAGCLEDVPYDAHYPYPRGKISDEKVSNVGLDLGQSGSDVRTAKILPGTYWTDVMTYCDYEWISDYTYEALLHLSQESAPHAAGRPSGVSLQSQASTDSTNGKSLVVVATINMSRMTGQLQDVKQADRPVSQKPVSSSDAAIRVVDREGKVLNSYPVAINLQSDATDRSDRRASINSSIPYSDEIASVQLVFRNKVLATVTSAAAPKATVSELFLKPSDQLSRPEIGIMTSAGIPVRNGMLVHWKTESEGPGVTYSIQISEDGEDWRTIAIHLKKSVFLIEKRNYEGSTSGLLHVKVIVNNGFTSYASSTQTIGIPAAPNK